MYHHQEDRPERTAALNWIHNPSAPLTETELEAVAEESTRILCDTLDKIVHGEEVISC